MQLGQAADYKDVVIAERGLSLLSMRAKSTHFTFRNSAIRVEAN